ncbi:hypothetical protein BCF11_1023 [Collimonas sp. PA-H2]|jgi:hypothetical protein|uniref:hypothetical protein n=1 Tax=unclassified Collimonas TaxID=2634148 RepID=UPI0008969161|nr:MULTISPECIES: hypothetical protein [unclassified Collimonas]PFH08656.1 hypothetical protein BCF11_1023 [Collimonas sp. PA-H2]SDY73397.1 hypothetical protein SAMN04515617_12080 [Collimonas sp. OK242]
MSVSGVNTSGLTNQSNALQSAIADLNSNTDPAKIPALAANVSVISAALESLKKAQDDSSKAQAGRA